MISLYIFQSSVSFDHQTSIEIALAIQIPLHLYIFYLQIIDYFDSQYPSLLLHNFLQVSDQLADHI